jgi:hypothetical protein
MQDSAAASVKATYEASWSGVRSAAELEIAAGETELSRLLHREFARVVGRRPAGEWQSLIFGRETPAPIVSGHRIARDWIADTVIEHAVRIGADAIIETGAGWGYNLFNIWLRGGPQVPCHAFEYTEAGRGTCRRVSEAARAGPQIEVHAFDYHTPDLAPAAGRYKRPLVYTSHSIEQIGKLPQSCIDAFLALAPEVEVLHFEPVGWQFEPDHWASGRVWEHCLANGYNENLWSLLQQNEDAGRLTIEDAQAHVMAPKLTNTSSLIHWRSRQSR